MVQRETTAGISARQRQGLTDFPKDHAGGFGEGRLQRGKSSTGEMRGSVAVTLVGADNVSGSGQEEGTGTDSRKLSQ